MIRLRAIRWLIIIGVVMGQLFSGASPAAAKVIINEKVEVLGEAYDECNQEMVQFSGILHIKVQEFHFEDGGVKSVSTMKLKGSGVGVNSGTGYQIQEKEDAVTFFHPVACMNSTTLETTTTLISMGGTPNMVLRTLVSIAPDENCFPVFGAAVEVECRF